MELALFSGLKSSSQTAYNLRLLSACSNQNNKLQKILVVDASDLPSYADLSASGVTLDLLLWPTKFAVVQSNNSYTCKRPLRLLFPRSIFYSYSFAKIFQPQKCSG